MDNHEWEGTSPDAPLRHGLKCNHGAAVILPSGKLAAPPECGCRVGRVLTENPQAVSDMVRQAWFNGAAAMRERAAKMMERQQITSRLVRDVRSIPLTQEQKDAPREGGLSANPGPGEKDTGG